MGVYVIHFLSPTSLSLAGELSGKFLLSLEFRPLPQVDTDVDVDADSDASLVVADLTGHPSSECH